MEMVAARAEDISPTPASGALPRRAAWDALAEAASDANPFYHPALLQPALDHLKRDGLHVLEAHDDSQLIGLMPVVALARHSRYPVRNSGNWMHEQCFYGAPLLRAGYEVAAWSSFLSQLDAADWAGNFLHMDGLDRNGPAAAGLLACCATERRTIRCIASHERALLQSNLSADDYWQSNVRSKKRKEIRRLIKRLEEMGTVAHARLRDGGDIAVWTEDFLALEGAGWKGAEGTALAGQDNSRAYFREALSNMHAAGMLDMLRIDLNGAPVAMLVNFHMGRGAFSYKIAYDERLSRFSPGVLIEIDNLQAALSDPGLDWMDSCAAPNHPMIDGIWAERRTMAQYRVALKGTGFKALKRNFTFAAIGMAEKTARHLKRTQA